MTIVPATQEHAEALAPLLRGADSAELLLIGTTPLEDLRWGVEHSAWARTALDPEPIAMFGVAPASLLGGLVGVAWFLSAPGVERHPVSMVRLGRRVVAAMQRRFPVLVNAIDARYLRAIRWARLIGFETFPEQRGFVPIRRG